MKTVAFFNPKGGVGTTTLVYHLTWMFQELGVSNLAVDLDPQAHLTETCLPDEALEDLWSEGREPRTIFGALQLLLDRAGDLAAPSLVEIEEHLALLPGYLGLSQLEDRFSGSEASDAGLALQHIVEQAARKRGADLALLDLGPGLTALNRASLALSDFLVVPLGADVPSLQGLHVLGSVIKDYRSGRSIGYVISQHAVGARPLVKASPRWIDRISAAYHHEILGAQEGAPLPSPDPHRLAILKAYPSLMFLAQNARKPMFLLKPADGAIGGLSEAVVDCYRDFKTLALRIAAACGIAVPGRSAA